MTDPGLSNRLRQHSRRSGLMVGLSMAAAIAIFIGGFVAIYAASVPWVSDIVPLPPRERTPTAEPVAAQEAPEANGPTSTSIVPAIVANRGGAAEPTAPPQETAAPEATETPEAFEPTHQIKPAQSIRFRAGPSTDDEIIRALAPLTALQYLDEDAPAANPDDAPRWMKFRTAENEEGWVRELDTEPYQED